MASLEQTKKKLREAEASNSRFQVHIVVAARLINKLIDQAEAAKSESVSALINSYIENVELLCKLTGAESLQSVIDKLIELRAAPIGHLSEPTSHLSEPTSKPTSTNKKSPPDDQEISTEDALSSLMFP